MKVYYFDRLADGENPSGVTVSKNPSLPSGDFQITAFNWGSVALWFVDADKFDDDEREAAYYGYLEAMYAH